MQLQQVKRMIRRLLPLVATSAFALGSHAANAADAPPALDPDIARLVREVSPARLETYVRTLAGFGTKVQTVQLGLTQVAVIRVELLTTASEKVTVSGEAVQVETESNTIGSGAGFACTSASMRKRSVRSTRSASS